MKARIVKVVIVTFMLAALAVTLTGCFDCSQEYRQGYINGEQAGYQEGYQKGVNDTWAAWCNWYVYTTMNSLRQYGWFLDQSLEYYYRRCVDDHFRYYPVNKGERPDIRP